MITINKNVVKSKTLKNKHTFYLKTESLEYFLFPLL